VLRIFSHITENTLSLLYKQRGLKLFKQGDIVSSVRYTVSTDVF